MDIYIGTYVYQIEGMLSVLNCPSSAINNIYYMYPLLLGHLQPYNSYS